MYFVYYAALLVFIGYGKKPVLLLNGYACEAASENDSSIVSIFISFSVERYVLIVFLTSSSVTSPCLAVIFF